MDNAYDFELTMRLLFGDKAYQIAGLEDDPSYRRKWLQKAILKLMRIIYSLDTTPRHKQMLMMELEAIKELLKGTTEPSWELVYRFLNLASRLLGYDYMLGAKCHSLSYWQTPEQYYTAHKCNKGNVQQVYQDQGDVISARYSVIENLKSKGFDDFKISLVLNTTEHEVKKYHARKKR
jgi:hypothetical protein